MYSIAYCYMMNRNHLALFHVVAQAGGISRGAALAHISQPAVSKQIRELEEELGVTLLERLPRGTRLTQAGSLLADYARRVNAMETDAARAIEELRGLKRGKLSIGASTSIGSYLLPGVLGEFHKRHPDIELHLEIANTRDIEQLLLAGEIELGLTEGAGEDARLDAKVFHRDDLVPIAPLRHPLLKKQRVSAAELCREPFVLREHGSGTRVIVEKALARLGLSLKPALALNSTEAIKRSVIAGIGLAIVSRLTIAQELELGLLATVPVRDLVIPRPLHLQRVQGAGSSPAAQHFLRLLPSSLEGSAERA